MLLGIRLHKDPTMLRGSIAHFFRIGFTLEAFYFLKLQANSLHGLLHSEFT